MAVLVVSCLSAIVGLIYIGYVKSTKHLTLTQTVRNVETEVKLEVDLMLRGGTSSTPSVDTGEAITGEITCDEYVRSLAQKYSHLRNLYDGSPMITLWHGWRVFQKRGKVRITCYKVHKGTTVSGSHCPLSKSGIRVDTYFTDCGAACNSDQCTIANKDCSNLNKKAKTEFEKYETNELFGVVLPIKGTNILDWDGMSETAAPRRTGRLPPERTRLLGWLRAAVQDEPDQFSRKLRSFRDRDGCFNLRSAFASIWRIRSRVTLNC